MRRDYLSLVIISIISTISFVYPCLSGVPVKGFVVDATSGEPLPVVNVVVKGESKGASTNLDGYFLIAEMEKGNYTLVVSYLGYYSQEKDIVVTDREKGTIKIELIPSTLTLKDVVYTEKVESESAIRNSSRVSTIPMDVNTIRNMPSLGAEVDVLRAMQSVPGVKASSEISSKLYVRGGSADMTQIQMDQATLYNPSHLFGLFSTFNGDAVKHIELMKGAFPAEYGGRAGSVLQVVTKDGNRKETEGVASVGLISARGSIEGPLPNNKGSYAFSARRTYLDLLLKTMKSMVDDVPEYYFYDTNGKVNIDISPKTTLTLGGYLGHDQLEFTGGQEDYENNGIVDWGNKSGFARLRQVLPFDSYITFGVAASRYRSGYTEKNLKENIVREEFVNGFDDLALRTDYEYYGLANHTMKTGVMAHHYKSKVHTGDASVEYVNIRMKSWNMAHYIQDTWKMGPHFELTSGLRWNWNEKGEQISLDPRFSLLYNHDNRTRFKLAAGRYHQYIDIIPAEEDIADVFDLWFPNDGTVDPLYSDQYVVGIEHDPSRQYQFTLETYYNKFYNVHQFDPQIDRAVTLMDALLTGEGYSYGAEIMLRKKEGDLTGWIGYSLAWSKRRFANSSYNNGEWFYPKWDRRHDLVVVGSYKLNHAWDVSTGWRYHTGQGFTRALGIYTDHKANTDEKLINVEYGKKNNYRLPDEHRLDLTFTYNHKFHGLPAKLNLSIYNVYNYRSIWFRNYETEENPVEKYDIKLLPVLPLVSYEVRF